MSTTAPTAPPMAAPLPALPDRLPIPAPTATPVAVAQAASIALRAIAATVKPSFFMSSVLLGRRKLRLGDFAPDHREDGLVQLGRVGAVPAVDDPDGFFEVGVLEAALGGPREGLLGAR